MAASAWQQFRLNPLTQACLNLHDAFFDFSDIARATNFVDDELTETAKDRLIMPFIDSAGYLG
jgi:hypothetical protein